MLAPSGIWALMWERMPFGARAIQASPRLGLGSPRLALSLPAAWPRYRVVALQEAGQYNLES